MTLNIDAYMVGAVPNLYSIPLVGVPGLMFSILYAKHEAHLKKSRLGKLWHVEIRRGL